MDPYAGAAPPPTQRKTSPWVYVGCGCALLIAIVAAAVLFFAKKVADEGRKMERGMSDPRESERRTRELLAYSELPPGYYPAGAFSIPFIFDMAFLGDRPPGAPPPPEDAASPGSTRPSRRHSHGPDFSDHGFIFMRMRVGRLSDNAAQRHRMLFSAGGKPAWEQGSGFSVASQESLGDGELNAGGAHIDYRATRGEVHVNEERHQAVTGMLLIECPDRRIRFGFWVMRDPAPGQPAATLDKTGTPADPRAITGFLDHFKLCAGGA